jgi:hypothetical protein
MAKTAKRAKGKHVTKTIDEQQAEFDRKRLKRTQRLLREVSRLSMAVTRQRQKVDRDLLALYNYLLPMVDAIETRAHAGTGRRNASTRAEVAEHDSETGRL